MSLNTEIFRYFAVERLPMATARLIAALCTEHDDDALTEPAIMRVWAFSRLLPSMSFARCLELRIFLRLRLHIPTVFHAGLWEKT